MKNIHEIVRENMEEAKSIIKSHGGEIDFVRDDWNGGINDFVDELPRVVLGGDKIIDAAVLGVKVNENDEILMRCYDVELNELIGWVAYYACAYNSENCVYEDISTYSSNG